ncbi:MAG: serine/threonine-protein kinase, partial [Chitinispirillia bacterium]
MLRIGNEFSKLLTLERGGQATIYRGWQESLQRYVALKKSDKIDPENGRAIIEHTRIISEKLITHTPAIFDCFIESKRVWIVMEYFEGLSLNKIHIRDWPLDVKLNIMYKVACIVQNIHSKGFIHGDLKPGNIMITREGSIKLVDFGMSFHSNTKSQPLQLQGTLSYIAPEKALQGEAYKPSIDIFSFGIILYEILNGQCPEFIGTDFTEPLKWSDEIPENIRDLTNSCIAPFPDQRPENFTHVRDAIKKELTSYLSDSYEQVLSESIEPEFCRYMAKKCMSAAEEVMSKNRLLSYTFLCEALEWDSDYSPVIQALEQFPPYKKHRVRVSRSLKFLIASICIAISGVGFILYIFKSKTPFAPPAPP